MWLDPRWKVEVWSTEDNLVKNCGSGNEEQEPHVDEMAICQRTPLNENDHLAEEPCLDENDNLAERSFG